MSKQPPPAPTASAVLPYCNQNCRTHRHWKFTQHVRTTRSPPVGQGPIAIAVGADGGCLDIFTRLCLFSSLSPSLWETAQYRLKYCLKGPVIPKQPTNQPTIIQTVGRPGTGSLPRTIAPPDSPPPFEIGAIRINER